MKEIYIDRPITQISEDCLGRAKFAQSLANALCSENIKDGYTVGLYGSWGCGKTSFIIKLENILRTASRGKFGRAKAEELKALAKRSVGNKLSDKSFQVTHTIEQIRLIEKQLDETEAHLSKLWDVIDSVLKTIPGIGAVDGAMIFSEIGDISRFRRPDQLIAFAGLDPATKQSGNFRADSTKMSKRGSPYLRFALVNAAWNVSMNNATFGEYYTLKLDEKGRHYKALGHVAGKLCRVIFKMLKDKVAFDLP